MNDTSHTPSPRTALGASGSPSSDSFIHGASRIEALCGERGKYRLDRVLLHAGPGGECLASATDGRVVATIHLDGSAPTKPLLLPPSGLAAARQAGRGKYVDEFDNYTPSLRLRVGATHVDTQFDISFPLEDAGAADMPNMASVMTEPERSVTFALDAALLHRLSDALGDSGVRITVPMTEDGKCLAGAPLIVTPYSKNGALTRGALMPLVVEVSRG